MKALLVFILLFAIFCFSTCSTPNTTKNAISASNLQDTSFDKDTSNFVGTWCNDSLELFYLNHLIIAPDISFFLVDPRLGVKLKNVFHNDTLLLYVVESYGEANRQKPEVPRGLFAKCFIVDSNLRIHYTQELFSQNIQKLNLDTEFRFQFSDYISSTDTQGQEDFEYNLWGVVGPCARYKIAFESNAKNGHDIRNNFIGQWCDIIHTYTDSLFGWPESYSLESLDISNDTSDFVNLGDQLSVECKNVYHADTLYLYVIDTDPSGWCFVPSFHTPKPKSLFAKCYRVDSSIRIYYTQKLFRDNIKKYKMYTAFSYKNPIIRSGY